MHLEAMEKRRDEEAAKEARAKKRKIEGATRRKQEECERKKEAEIISGRRDHEGKIIAIKRTIPMALATP